MNLLLTLSDLAEQAVQVSYSGTKQQVDLMLFASSRFLAAYSLKEQFFNVLDLKKSDSARTPSFSF